MLVEGPEGVQLDEADAVRRVAMVSVHTSPLDQPGTGDAGGMNVYVVELARRLAAAGIEVDIFTRATSSRLDPVVRTGDGVARVWDLTADRPRVEVDLADPRLPPLVRNGVRLLGNPDPVGEGGEPGATDGGADGGRQAPFDGAGVSPSPRISVVTPCVVLLTAPPSPYTNASTDCPCMSMNPGTTIMPAASIRRAVCAASSVCGAATVAMRSPRIPMSARYHGLPVPSITRPLTITTSNGPLVSALASPVCAGCTDAQPATSAAKEIHAAHRGQGLMHALHMMCLPGEGQT